MFPELENLASFYPFNYTSVGGANMKKTPLSDLPDMRGLFYLCPW